MFKLCFRSEWVVVTDNIMLSVPLKTRLINASEMNALNELCATIGLDAFSTNMSGSYSQRILKSEEVFHARTYRRSKKSCSYVVQFCLPNDDNEFHYGEIQEFVSIATLIVAFVKPFPHVVTSICTNAIAASSDETVQQFSSAKLLGNHHTPVSYSTDSDLVAVLCKDIVAKCIVVETNEPFVDAYITTVNDINCT